MKNMIKYAHILNLNMNTIFNKLHSKFAAMILIALTFVGIVGGFHLVHAQTFLAGPHFLAANVTTGAPFADPQSGNPGEVIEFRMLAQNDSSATINNAVVSADLPSTPTATIVASSTVSADNASSISDNVTINVIEGEQQGLAYIPGHVRIFSTACPGGCAGSDNVTSGGVPVGNIAPGESAQVLFKAYITNNAPAPSASPSPSPSPSPSVAPSTSTGQSGVVQCPAGTTQTVSGNTIICIQNQQQQTQTVTQTNSQNVNVTQNQAAAASQQPQVLGVKTLPKTGLPVQALLGFGSLPVGLLLRKFTKGSKVEKDPDFIWNDRQFKIDS